MEALFIFIAKSSGLLVLFYCAYYFLLRKETFFNSSRWFLLAGLITSVLLPLLVYTKIVWIEPAPAPTPSTTVVVMNATNIADKASEYSNTYLSHPVQKDSFDINWNYVLLAIYAIGFLALVLKFIIDFYSLNSVLKGKKVLQQADFKFVDINENIAPFSYFDYIVYNSSMYTASELENIIEHEKVHSDQNHTIDVLISRAFCVLFWFNPIIWLYKKAILQNLEFIADSEAAKIITDKKAYQYTLLKITAHESCVAITNHFYQSLIKKRIVMLNKNQSKKRNYWKYYAVIPALVAFVLLFQIQTVAQEKDIAQQTSKSNDSDDIYNITKNTTDQELKVIAEKLKKNHDADVTVSNVKRNSKNELIGIRINIKKGSKEVQTIQINGDEAIDSFGIAISTEKNGVKKIGVVTDSETKHSTAFQNRVAEADETNDQVIRNLQIAPPVPPVPPVFPNGALPSVPPVDMSKMPKAPAPPANPKDKIAMAEFEKKMDEFEKQMEAFEPDMSAYEKQIEEIMGQREVIFEKEMEKYELAMQKFNSEMDKFTQAIQLKYGKDSKEYEINSKEYEKNMKQLEIDMKQHEKDMKKYEKEMKKLEKETRKS